MATLRAASTAPVGGRRYWDLVGAELRACGARRRWRPDLPCEDDAAGLDRVRGRRGRGAIGDRRDGPRAGRPVARRASPRRWWPSGCRCELHRAGDGHDPGARARPGGEWWAQHRARRGHRRPGAARRQRRDAVHPRRAGRRARGRRPDRAASPARRWRSRGRWPPGRTCRPGSCSAPTTASSHRSGCARSCANGSASSPTTCRAATARTLAVPGGWPRPSPNAGSEA